MFHVWLMGKTQGGFLEAGVAEYIRKLGRWRRLRWHELPAPSTPSSAGPNFILGKEAEVWKKHWPEKGRVALLHNDGLAFDSERFSQHIFHLMDTWGQVHWMVGGPYGFAPEIRARAHEVISLSPMIFNHQLVRLIFLEQLFRAFCIRHGVPYHHP
ncbi:MAG: 23S rRNA (pseudouridine(1915)-N(3))-methyltransferase RlmH [Flavobacteriales bacterium]|nr:23S rRNA (pseudouridine(1915)-N(3))-methyltransferase RlmH [Flavobacteriales bacterium]